MVRCMGASLLESGRARHHLYFHQGTRITLTSSMQPVHSVGFVTEFIDRGKKNGKWENRKICRLITHENFICCQDFWSLDFKVKHLKPLFLSASPLGFAFSSTRRTATVT
jgi:hypothetical protein